MSKQLEVSVELNAPIEVCFEAAYLDEEMMRWVPMPRSVVYDHSNALEPYGVGAERLVTLKSGISLTERITLSDRPSKIIYEIDRFGMGLDWMLNEYHGQMDFKVIDDNRTTLTWSVHYNCKGIGKLMSPMFRFVFKKLIQTMADNMQRHLANKNKE